MHGGCFLISDGVVRSELHLAHQCLKCVSTPQALHSLFFIPYALLLLSMDFHMKSST